MKIANSSVSLSSSSETLRVEARSERLRMWVGREPGSEAAPVSAAQAPRGGQAPEQVPAPARAENKGDCACETSDSGFDRNLRDLLILLRTVDPKADLDAVLRNVEEIQNSYSAQPLDLGEANGNVPTPPSSEEGVGFGLEYDLEEHRIEAQRTQFQARGSVTTADGREINFATELEMSRLEASSRTVSVRAGDAAKRVDPLVLNFGTGAPSFAGTHEFDLTSDGEKETLARLTPASAYLAWDQNGNDTIDNGSELFGPTTGNGFSELAAHDGDGNGWIDEADPMFSRLRLWSPSEEGGGTLKTLAEVDVGALYLHAVSTPFSVRSGGTAQAEVAASSVYLKESQGVGTLQHVDLVA